MITSDQDIKGSSEINLYPVPASDLLHISFSEEQDVKSILLILDALGRSVAKYAIQQTTKLSIDTSEFPSGLYQLVVLSPDARVGKRFIVQH